MNDCDYVFSPSLNTSFISPSPYHCPDFRPKEINSRYLFYLLSKQDNSSQISSISYNFICDRLKTANDSNISSVIHKYKTGIVEQLQSSYPPPLAHHFSILENQLECVRQSVAIQLTQPAWLQNISQISCCQSDCVIQIMSLFIGLTQGVVDNITLEESYKSLLLMTGIKEPILYSQDFIDQTDLLETTFGFASIQRALMLFPRQLFPEILGFTLAFCQLPTLVEICFPRHQLSSAYFKHRQQHLDQKIIKIQCCISHYLSLLPQRENELWLRIQNGFFLYQLEMKCFRDQFATLLENKPTLQQEIIQLFQKKNIAAIGHHQNILLEGIPLDEWFSTMPESSLGFLKALKKSGYVDKKNPEQSQLLKLFDCEGPMFGVLNNKEHALLLRWLKSEEHVSLEKMHSSESLISKNTLLSKTYFSHSKSFEKLNNRKLYYYLVNADLFPDVLVTARNRVKKLLRMFHYFCHIPFKQYSHEKLDSYIAKIYHREMTSYKPLQGEPKISKKAYVWGIEQIAPMILIDGCWLQKSLDIKEINPEVANILFNIYCDEVGNGVLEKNHPYIFQKLLTSLSISLPAVHSQEFVDHPGFINSAFDLPVYMLALSHFSAQFLPELLGLNMAIELSGLGKSYMQLVDDWNYWDIDPTIASIHISIDNYASGHTFLAQKAIKLYLDQIYQSTGDSLIVDQHWQRICCGYASLRFAGARFKLMLPSQYLLTKYLKNKD